MRLAQGAQLQGDPWTVRGRHTLLAALDELRAVLDELLGDVENLLNCVGHCELGCVVLVRRVLVVAITGHGMREVAAEGPKGRSSYVVIPGAPHVTSSVAGICGGAQLDVIGHVAARSGGEPPPRPLLLNPYYHS